MKEENITLALMKVFEEDNPGILPDEAYREAQSVLSYYRQIKRAETIVDETLSASKN